MSKDLVVQDDFDLNIALNDIDKMYSACRKLLSSPHYKPLGEAGVFAILQKAKSLNMNPMEALNGSLYYVNGKVGMSTEAMNALIRRSGHSITKDPKSNNSICILHGRRADNGDTWTCSFSLEDAKKAGLLKNMFEKYPSVMLFNRAMSMLARQLFPDVIKGAGYTQEELVEISDRKVLETKMLEFSEDVKEFISDEQASKINEMLDACPDTVKSKFLDFIKNAPVSAETIEQIPVDQYQTIYDLVKKRYDKAMEEKAKAECQTALHSEDSIVQAFLESEAK